MVIIFDADIFEEKVSGYDEFIADVESRNIGSIIESIIKDEP
ncbi:MAG: hypothetical protein Q4E57_07345 [Eubacteriales bacterium]|nr:hypothetical protein [Eubacteriales bacterium]